MGLVKKDMQIWKNKDIENLFEIIYGLRGKYFEIIKADNAALYDLTLECDENSLELLTNTKHLYECFGCASLELKQLLTDSSNDSTKNKLLISLENGQNYSFLLSKSKTKNHICIRCRKYNSKGENQLCDRCDKVNKHF